MAQTPPALLKRRKLRRTAELALSDTCANVSSPAGTGDEQNQLPVKADELRKKVGDTMLQSP